jgi:hypothetical protein
MVGIIADRQREDIDGDDDAVAPQIERHHRLGMPPLVEEQQDEGQRGDHEQARDLGDPEFARLHQRQDERARSTHQQDRAPIVDGVSPRRALLVQRHENDRDGDDADRQVDPEYSLPGDMLYQKRTEQRAGDRRDAP